MVDLVILGVLLLVLGLRIQPQPFAAYPEQSQMETAVPIPSDLPVPVARYYQATMPEEVPVLETAVVTARGHLRFAGITFPDRYGLRMRRVRATGIISRPPCLADLC